MNEFYFFSNPTPIEDPFLQNVIWPKVDFHKPDSIQYLNINNTLEIRTNPRSYQEVKTILDQYLTSVNIH